jgi:hypothetical protein
LQKSPEANPGTSEVKQGLIHEGVTLEALGETTKAIEPGEEPFHDPTVGGKFLVGVGTVFEFSSIRGSPQRNAVADSALDQTEAKRLGVIAPVRGQATGTGTRAASSARNPHLRQGQRRGSDIGHVACGQIRG